MSSTDPYKKTYTLIEHLAELRKRLIIIVVLNLAVAVCCYQFMAYLIQIILDLNLFMKLIYITPSELFMVYIKLALMLAIVLCFPITLLQLWLFVAKGLLKREKVYILISLFFGMGFFLLGAVFCYYVVLPIALQFFYRISLEGIDAMISIDSFVSFCTTMMISFGAAFELPIVVFLLSELSILKPSVMKRGHGIFIILIFIFAAIITPPDIVSQILLAIPMVALLELSNGVCWVVDRQKNRKKLD